MLMPTKILPHCLNVSLFSFDAIEQVLVIILSWWFSIITAWIIVKLISLMIKSDCGTFFHIK